LKKKFENSKVTLTPEQHAAALRQKERDQLEAVRIAKARAARYNMTLRSLELQNASLNSVAQATRKDEPKRSYQQPGRRVSSMKKTTQTDVEVSQGLLASALSHERDPKLAVDVVKVVAAQVEESLKTETSASAEDNAKAKQEAEDQALVAAKEEERKVAEEEEKRAKAEAEMKANDAEAYELKRKRQLEEEERDRKAAEAEAEVEAAEQSAAVDDGASFEMKSLTEALEQGSDEAINKAIVTDFLQEHNPPMAKQVDKIMQDNKGHESELMKDLVDQYADPVANEIKVTAEVIVRVESDQKQEAPVEEFGSDIDALEQQRRDAERIKQEEESKITAMDDNEKKIYLEKLAEQAKHSEEKDKMLKSQLNVYGSGGAAALLGGRGRGRGKNRPKSDRQTEYIVNAKNEGGQWEVNTE